MYVNKMGSKHSRQQQQPAPIIVATTPEAVAAIMKQNSEVQDVQKPKKKLFGRLKSAAGFVAKFV